MTASDGGSDAWYWCLRHSRVERGSESRCPPDDRLGPYESEDAAKRWRERVDSRNQKWEREDKEWSGD